jgi:hypothetical protein
VTQEFQTQRKLTAVFAADVEVFSRLMSTENGTLRELASQRSILDAAITKYRGRIANTAVVSTFRRARKEGLGEAGMAAQGWGA